MGRGLGRGQCGPAGRLDPLGTAGGRVAEPTLSEFLRSLARLGSKKFPWCVYTDAKVF